MPNKGIMVTLLVLVVFFIMHATASIAEGKLILI
jgi:hypothetical protein